MRINRFGETILLNRLLERRSRRQVNRWLRWCKGAGMRKNAIFVFALMASLMLVSCGGGNSTPTTPVGGPVPGYPVSLTMMDDPPAGVNVLFFQVTLTSATLTQQSNGGPVALISMPIQIDVTQLQALSAFLNTVNSGAGVYTGLNLTFANPQLVIFNASDAGLGSGCAVGSICQLTPSMQPTTVALTAAPFPLTLSANNSLGLVVDFHLNTVIQPDLSVNLGATNGITVSQLPSTPGGPPRFGYLRGTVEALHADSSAFTLQTAWGGTFWVTTNGSTTWNDFPSTACSTAGLGCLGVGQAVQVQVASVDSTTGLTAAQVTYLDTAGAQSAEGTVLFVTPPVTNIANAPWMVEMILHTDPMNVTALPLGGLAQVQVDPAATFAVGANGFTMPSGLSFGTVHDVYAGQTIQAAIEPGTLTTSSTTPTASGWAPPPSVTFTTNSLQLEPSQMSGMISSIGTGSGGAGNFSLGLNLAFLGFPASTAVTLDNVQTTAQTAYQGFTPDDFTGLAANQFVSVSGWVFAPANLAGAPTMVAQTVVLRP
jgi:Domain of unknown function (DUF4382)